MHCMAYMKPEAGVHFVISGGGGVPLRGADKLDPRAVYAETAFGFVGIALNDEQMDITFYDDEGRVSFSDHVRK